MFRGYKWGYKLHFLEFLQLYQQKWWTPPPPSHLFCLGTTNIKAPRKLINVKGIGYTNLTIIHHQNKMDMDHHIYQQNLNVKQHFRFSDLN